MPLPLTVTSSRSSETVTLLPLEVISTSSSSWPVTELFPPERITLSADSKVTMLPLPVILMVSQCPLRVTTSLLAETFGFPTQGLSSLSPLLLPSSFLFPALLLSSEPPALAVTFASPPLLAVATFPADGVLALAAWVVETAWVFPAGLVSAPAEQALRPRAVTAAAARAMRIGLVFMMSPRGVTGLESKHIVPGER